MKKKNKNKIIISAVVVLLLLISAYFVINNLDGSAGSSITARFFDSQGREIRSVNTLSVIDISGTKVFDVASMSIDVKVKNTGDTPLLITINNDDISSDFRTFWVAIQGSPLSIGETKTYSTSRFNVAPWEGQSKTFFVTVRGKADILGLDKTVTQQGSFTFSVIRDASLGILVTVVGGGFTDSPIVSSPTLTFTIPSTIKDGVWTDLPVFLDIPSTGYGNVGDWTLTFGQGPLVSSQFSSFTFGGRNNQTFTAEGRCSSSEDGRIGCKILSSTRMRLSRQILADVPDNEAGTGKTYTQLFDVHAIRPGASQSVRIAQNYVIMVIK